MPTYLELQDEIQRLRDEQQRLRDEQEKLRRQENGKGNGNQGENRDQKADQQPDSKKDDGQAKDDAKDQGNDQGKDRSEAKPPGDDQKKAGDDQKKDGEKPAGKPKPTLRVRAANYARAHPLAVLLGAIALVLIGIGTVLLLSYLHSYESTDDAEVDGHLNAISTRIAGTLTAVYVEDNQFVEAGQVLMELDPKDFQTSLQQARAQVAESQAQVTAENPNVPITMTTTQTTISSSQADVLSAEASVASAQQDYDAKIAAVRQAEVNHTKAALDRGRFQLLVDKDEISKQQFDASVATERNTADAIDAARASAESSRKMIETRRAQLAEAQSRLQQANQNAPRQVAVRKAEIQARQAGLLAARAQEEAARLNLSYTRIVAPVSGIIVQKTAEVGMRIQPGQDLMSISQIDDIWITANFKETQLKRMKPGQSADVQVDAFGVNYHGYIEDLPGATGAKTSLLPPENATGNYVKVVQRLPVRIRLKPGEDRERRLRPGMSVEPKVWLNTGS